MTTERPEGDIDSTWTPAQMATELRRLAGCKVAPELWPTECVAIAAALDLADALAKAVEAMWANRAWESTSAPEKLNKGDFIIG